MSSKHFVYGVKKYSNENIPNPLIDLRKRTDKHFECDPRTEITENLFTPS